ncbi:MAG: hypothetical protein KDI56_08530, partial [Xanthomonadales bacterium]|nr:hypothetical protein [Xanthomonadales bacterium]
MRGTRDGAQGGSARDTQVPESTEGRPPLSYLKGFIFPTVTTLAFRFLTARAARSSSPVLGRMRPPQHSDRAVAADRYAFHRETRQIT